MEYKNFLDSSDEQEQWAFDRSQGLYFRLTRKLVADRTEIAQLIEPSFEQPETNTTSGL
jgi:hypothetical protein